MAFETVSETLNPFGGRGLTAPTGSDLYFGEGTGAAIMAKPPYVIRK